MSRRDGYSLIELLIVLGIIGIMILVALPVTTKLQRRAALRAASTELRGIFQLARSRAIAHSANCGIKFFQIANVWVFALYDDGDGDGVRNDDITRGTDRMVTTPRVVLPESPAITIGVLAESIRDPDGDRLTAKSSPIVFGRSTICSFSPLGASTPGTIYITDRRSDLYAVRVYGTTAKVRMLRYDRGTKRWVS